jgi:hypothetical protein
MGHDGDSADHDEVDTAARQCPQVPLVVGLECPRGHR